MLISKLEINEKTDVVEKMTHESIKRGICSLSTIIPEIKILLNPIIDAAFQRQITSGFNLLQKSANSDNGCWNSILNVDGVTDNYHTEHDCSYTFLTVPTQVMDKRLDIATKPVFLFQLTEHVQLMIPLSNDLSFVYNSQFLTHRQSYNPLGEKIAQKFYNITSYSNEKIFNHLRKSFSRLEHMDP